MVGRSAGWRSRTAARMVHHVTRRSVSVIVVTMVEPGEKRAAVRIIDANLNRAREALRVMEDYARFGLDDELLTSDLKSHRHALREAIPSSLECSAALERDIVGDVGRAASTRLERHRSTSEEVAVAAGKRLGEALRSVEEYGKVLDPALADRVEKLRYAGYELERRLMRHSIARARFGSARLYIIITEAYCRGDWYAAAQAAIAGGADCLQLREKGLGDRDLIARARRLAALCRRFNVLFIVNDRPDVAVISGADGVHIGRDDMSVADARRVLPPTAIVGVSAHKADEVAAAVRQAPDYVAVGPMFPTKTKPQRHVAGPETLASARATTSLPLVAIGGIDADNAARVLAAGDCCLCACSSVIGAVNVTAAATALRAVATRDCSAATTPDQSNAD